MQCLPCLPWRSALHAASASLACTAPLLPPTTLRHHKPSPPPNPCPLNRYMLSNKNLAPNGVMQETLAIFFHSNFKVKESQVCLCPHLL